MQTVQQGMQEAGDEQLGQRDRRQDRKREGGARPTVQVPHAAGRGRERLSTKEGRDAGCEGGGGNHCTKHDEHLGGVRTNGETCENPPASDRERRKAAEDAAHRTPVLGQALRRIEGGDGCLWTKAGPMERKLLETIRNYEDGEARRRNDEAQRRGDVVERPMLSDTTGLHRFLGMNLATIWWKNNTGRNETCFLDRNRSLRTKRRDNRGSSPTTLEFAILNAVAPTGRPQEICFGKGGDQQTWEPRPRSVEEEIHRLGRRPTYPVLEGGRCPEIGQLRSPR